MRSTERAEIEGERLDEEGVKTILPTPEMMMTYRWFTDLDDRALAFTSALQSDEADPESTEAIMERHFDGDAYRWIWSTREVVDGNPVETKVTILLRPDRLLRGTELTLIGFSSTHLIKEDDVPGIGTGGPELMGLRASLDMTSEARAIVLDQLSEYLPNAWNEGSNDRKSMPVILKFDQIIY